MDADRADRRVPDGMKIGNVYVRHTFVVDTGCTHPAIRSGISTTSDPDPPVIMSSRVEVLAFVNKSDTPEWLEQHGVPE